MHTIEVKVKDGQHDANGDVLIAPEGNRQASKIEDGQHDTSGDSSKSASFEIAPPANNAPVLDTFTPDKESPQATGTAIAWTASAEDAEGDLISYRFLLNGTPVSDWQTEGQWIWTAAEPGTSTVTVQAKDSQHDGPQGESGNLSRDFTITSPAPVMAEEEEAPQAAGECKLKTRPGWSSP